MLKRQSPTVTQANILFFITAVITLAGSAFFQPKLGLGTNLWINEFVYILLPPLLLAKVNGWSVEDIYRFKESSIRNMVISSLSGFSLWFFAFYVSKITRILLDNKIGVLANPQQTSPSIYQSLLLAIGMIVLAPFCEEIYFRGFVQKAYEGHSKRYGFVIAGFIFGAYHVLNGISEVIPACILGFGMGYLVYKTDSIATSMLFHATANTCAVFMGGALEMSAQAAIPVWLHIIALAGLGSSLIFLRSLKAGNPSHESKDEVHKNKRMPATGMLFLILSAIFLTAVGVLEVLARSGIVK